MAAERRGWLRAGAQAQAPTRLKIAVPSKGRLREPAIELLHDVAIVGTALNGSREQVETYY